MNPFHRQSRWSRCPCLLPRPLNPSYTHHYLSIHSVFTESRRIYRNNSILVTFSLGERQNRLGSKCSEDTSLNGERVCHNNSASACLASGRWEVLTTLGDVCHIKGTRIHAVVYRSGCGRLLCLTDNEKDPDVQTWHPYTDALRCYCDKSSWRQCNVKTTLRGRAASERWRWISNCWWDYE